MSIQDTERSQTVSTQQIFPQTLIPNDTQSWYTMTNVQANSIY